MVCPGVSKYQFQAASSIFKRMSAPTPGLWCTRRILPQVRGVHSNYACPIHKDMIVGHTPKNNYSEQETPCRAAIKPYFKHETRPNDRPKRITLPYTPTYWYCTWGIPPAGYLHGGNSLQVRVVAQIPETSRRRCGYTTKARRII